MKKKIQNSSNIPGFFRVIFIELSMSFFRKKITGSKDFLKFFILLLLIFTFSFLLMGSKEGLSDKLVDVILGRVPGYGIPIWVRSNPFSDNGYEKQIDDEIVNQVHSNTGLNLYPYKEVHHAMIGLPDDNIWISQNKNEISEFYGIATSEDDPLWKYSLDNYNKSLLSDNSFIIVLSRSVFKNNFNIKAYESALLQHLPHNIPEPYPLAFSQNAIVDQPDKANYIYLLIGQNKDLIPIQVIWVDKIPIPGNFAYLFSLNKLHSLQKALQYNFNYFPESKSRINQIYIRQEIEDKSKDNLLKCLNRNSSIATFVTKRGMNYIEFKYPQPEFWIKYCFDSLNIDEYQTAEQEQSLNVEFKKWGNFGIPCMKLNLLTEKESFICEQNPQALIYKKIDGYRSGFLYVKDRKQISKKVKEINSLDNKPLIIPWVYHNTLSRLGALTKLLDILKKPFIIIFIIFLVSIIWINIDILVTNRINNYGIFLSKGINYKQIYFMVYSQTILCIVSSWFLAIIFFIMCSWWLNYILLKAMIEFKDFLSFLNSSRYLYLESSDFLIVLSIGILLDLIITTLILYFLPLTSKTMPDALLNQ